MSRRRWWIGGALGLLALLVIAAGAAWYAQSGLARWLALRQLGVLTGRHATVERLDLDLRAGRLHMAGLRLADRAPGPPLAEIDRLDVRFDPIALLRGRTVIHEAALAGVRARIVRSERGELNIADLLARPAREGASDITLTRLTLAGGAVSLEDRTRTPVHTWRADAIALELNHLSTLSPEPRGDGRISATVAGAPVSGHLSELRLTPLRLRGRLALREVDATLAGIYLPADARASVDGARLTANLGVLVDARDGTALDADGRLEGVALRNRRTGAPVAEIPALAFTVAGARAGPAGHAPRVGRVEITGGATVHDARGGGSRLAIDRIRLQLVDAEGGAPGTARMSLSAGLPGGGALDVEGPVRIAPLGAELRARIAKLDPAVLLSFADLPVSLTGVVDGDLAVDVASSDGVSARIKGRAGVSRAAASDGGAPLATVARIDLDGIEIDVTASKPPTVRVARARVVQPVATVERDGAGRISLADRLSTAAPSAPGGAASAGTGPTVDIGEIAVDDGTIALHDAAVSPPARLTLSKLRGTARSVAWPARRPVAIDLQAATPGAGTLSAQGTVSLDPLRLDLRARLAGAALAPYQGYVPFPARVQGIAHADLAVTGALSPAVDVRAKGTASLTDLSASDGDRRVMRVSRVETTGLDYAWPSSLAVDRLRIGRSWVRVERHADGRLPILALFASAPAPDAVRRGAAAPAAPALSVTVREAILEDGAARITDAAVSPPARIDLTGVRLAAQAFRWPARGPVPIELRVGTPGGGSASARGTLDLAAAGIDAKVTLAGVDLAPARPYVPLHGQIAGKVSGEIEVTARLEPLAVAVRGDAVLADLAIAQGDVRVVTAARAETKGLDYTYPTTLAIERLRVQGPRAMVERRRDGTLPLLALLSAPAGAAPAASAVRAEASAGPRAGGERGAGAPSAAAPPLDLSVREAVLEDGSFVLSDAAVSPPARIEVRGIRLGARDVAWPWRRPASVEMRVPMPAGGTVRARGQIAAAGAGLELDVTAEGVDVAPVRPYLPLRGHVTGKATAQLKVGATLEPMALTARGTASLADLAVTDGGRRLLAAAHAEVTGLDYTWPATVSIDRLRVQKPWALVDRVSGKLPVLDALVPGAPTGSGTGPRPPGTVGPPPPTAPPAPASPSAPRPQLSVRRSLVEDGAVTIVDTGVRPPAQIDIGGARLSLRDFAWPARGPAGFTLRATARDGTTIEARGRLGLEPSSIDSTLALGGMELATFQPFFPARTRIAGRATANLQVKGALVPLDLSITGQMAVTDGSVGDPERTLATAKRIELAGLAAEWPRGRAVIQRATVREPWALVERDASGALPLLSLVTMRQAEMPAPGAAAPPRATARGPVAAAATAPARAAEAAQRDAPSVEVATLAVEEGFVRFIDATTRPRFVEEASRLAVTVRGLGTAPASRGEVAVSARLTGGAQVELSGVMGPLGGPLVAEASGKLSGLPLNRINPYLSGLCGWVARQGSVDGTTRFRIRDDYLEADNEVVIGRPEFVPTRGGDEVRKRVGIPLDTLVSLMENARREVRLSLPIKGTISDRQFDFGDAVWDAVRTAAINVLALPVSWVGKIFYTADSRIDTISIWPVSFEPGTTRMRRGIDAHAARLATFMRDTPAVAFALKPVMTVEDVDALKREAVRQRLAGGGAQPDAAAAATLFTQRFPGRPVPGELDAVIAELAKEEPSPASGLRALAAQRLDVTRRELTGKGVDAARLRPSDAAVPIEASGAGRVEFEMMPLAPPAS